MIRILQVVTHMNRGGLETMLMNYYRYIDRTRFQFDFLTHRQYDGDFGEEIASLGGKVYHLPVLNPFNPHYKKSLGRFFDEHPEYQVIHVHQDCMSSVILKIAKQHGVKVRIAHSHSDSQDKNLKYPIKMFYRKKIPQYATELMACGQDAGKWMFGSSKFRILNNAIDTKKYCFDIQIREKMRKKLNIDANELLIGHVGRFSPPKNHDFLIDIFEKIDKKTQSKLIMVGEGELQAHIKDKVDKAGLTDKVIFTGVRTDVSDLLQAMDVFLFPSLFEGFGIVALEAQAAGLPVVVSERIPDECKVTDLIDSLNLNNNIDIWAEKVLNASKTKRRNTFEEIKKAGFDIQENAKCLQEFYLKVANGE